MAQALICSTCGAPILSQQKAFLIADDSISIGLHNWRVVHQGVCDPHGGRPWHPLLPYRGEHYTSRGKEHRIKLLNTMYRQKAFKSSSVDELKALASALVLSFDGKRFLAI